MSRCEHCGADDHSTFSCPDPKPQVSQATSPWDGKCDWCGEDELEGGTNGGKCMYCGNITIPPRPTTCFTA